jgi:Leucine-rich repeat (LRR) protein
MENDASHPCSIPSILEKFASF